MTPHQRTVLAALVECHDGAATVSWLMQYTGYSLSTVQRCLWRLREEGLARQVGFTRPPAQGGRPGLVFAATVPGRRAYVLEDAA
jgi:predicted transcriptional regulator